MDWTQEEEKVARGEIEAIDYYLAKSLLKDQPQVTEKQVSLISRLMSELRQGHLCLSLAPEDVDSLPLQLVEEVSLSTRFPRKPLCRFNDLLYFQKSWISETRFLKQVQRLCQMQLDPVLCDPAPDLNSEQREALSRSLSHSFSLITGGPGTGKTYTAARIVDQLIKKSEKPLKIAVAAPTGKAAACLQEGLIHIGIPEEAFRAQTLHALLGIRHAGDLNQEGTLLAADVLLVDECSMIDARLFAYLLASVQQGTRLILMGDPDQLPPVEAGSFFADLVEAAPALGLACSRLNRCMRSDQLGILSLAQQMKEGGKVIPDLDLGLESLRPEIFYQKLWEYVKERFTEEREFQLLSCIRKGPYGVDAINHFLFEQFRREGVARVPILFMRTDLRMNIYNGDTAMLYFPDQIVLSDGTSSPAAALPVYEYAYCLSVHKSQGSEYPHVLLLVPPGSETFGREILYTAVTRAKKSIVIAAHAETLAQALQTQSRRRSGLSRRLIESENARNEKPQRKSVQGTLFNSVG